jgi:hypothetical protein
VSTKVILPQTEQTDYFQFIRNEADTEFKKDEWLIKSGVERNKFDQAFKEFANSLPLALCKAADEMQIPFSLTSENIILHLFNENVRSFITNLLNSYRYKVLFEVKKQLMNRPYVFLEGVFLDGSLYIDSTEKKEWRESFVNIFYHKRSTLSHIWHGLCGLRVLQLVLKGNRAKEDIIATLSQLFDYNPVIIEEFIQRFVQHGLIEPNSDIENPSVQYGITRKGQFLMHASLSNIDFLYFLSLDTPLKSDLLSKTNYVMVHKKFWSNYTECCVKTAITMMRHINSKLEQEYTLLGKKMQKSEVSTILCKYFRSINISFDRVLDQMVGMILSLEKDKDEGGLRRETLMKDIQGLVGDIE